MSDVRPRHPHIKENWGGGVGEWISILEDILTLGTKVMRHPAFRIFVILQNLKNIYIFSLNQTIIISINHNHGVGEAFLVLKA